MRAALDDLQQHHCGSIGNVSALLPVPQGVDFKAVQSRKLRLRQVLAFAYSLDIDFRSFDCKRRYSKLFQLGSNCLCIVAAELDRNACAGGDSVQDFVCLSQRHAASDKEARNLDRSRNCIRNENETSGWGIGMASADVRRFSPSSECLPQ
jgi:hypothetical protein